MKRTLAILVAVLVIALSAIPAFAAEVDYKSPAPTIANYQITIIPGTEGGSYDFEYKTPVDDDGNQTVHFHAKPDEGFEFTGWTFEGNYTPLGNLTDTELDVIVSGDIKATPNFKKIGSSETTEKKDTKIDDSSKSPKTGTNYVYVGIACVALIGLLFAAKKSIYKK